MNYIETSSTLSLNSFWQGLSFFKDISCLTMFYDVYVMDKICKYGKLLGL